MIKITASMKQMSVAWKTAFWTIGSAILFSMLGAIVRHLSEHMHTFQVSFFRCAAGLVFMLPWLLHQGMGALKTRRLGLYTARCFLGLVSMQMGFYALSLISFADSTALSFTTPLFATAMAALFLGEVVRIRRWTATIIGFIGVIIIIRPGAGALNIGVLLATGAAALSAVVTLIVKQLTKTESPTTIVTFMVLLMTPMALPLAIWVWQAPAPIDWLWILLMGVCGSAGHICLVRAFALADASVVMNYDYTRMVFATMIGWIAFGEFPDLWTWIGSGVIVASTLYIAHREALRRQSIAAPAAAKSGDPAA